MGLELIIFIAAILFGVFLYWRESKNNKVFRAVNKIFNSKELQIKADNKKGFIYLRSFIPRLIFVTFFFLIMAVILQFLTPISIFSSYIGMSLFASTIVGTLIGTYLANFIIKSTDIIEEKTESLETSFKDTINKGKEIIEDFKDTNPNEKMEQQIADKAEKTPKKSARERLKDKDLL